MLLACRMSSLCSNLNIQVSLREQDGNTTRGDPREIKTGKVNTVRQILSRTPGNPGPPCFLEPNFLGLGAGIFSARSPESRQNATGYTDTTKRIFNHEGSRQLPRC
jgi:hypothetical protein